MNEDLVQLIEAEQLQDRAVVAIPTESGADVARQLLRGNPMVWKPPRSLTSFLLLPASFGILSGFLSLLDQELGQTLQILHQLKEHRRLMPVFLEEFGIARNVARAIIVSFIWFEEAPFGLKHLHNSSHIIQPHMLDLAADFREVVPILIEALLFLDLVSECFDYHLVDSFLHHFDFNSLFLKQLLQGDQLWHQPGIAVGPCDGRGG